MGFAPEAYESHSLTVCERPLDPREAHLAPLLPAGQAPSCRGRRRSRRVGGRFANQLPLSIRRGRGPTGQRSYTSRTLPGPAQPGGKAHQVAGLIVLIVIVVLLLIAFFSSYFTVEQQTSALVERFGKFRRVAGPGLNFKIPFIERVSGRINLRVQQLDVTVETKTKDNVFVHIIVAVQYMVLGEKIYDAFYRLDQPTVQITAYVFDVVRARVPKMELDDVFERKDEVAIAVKEELSGEMETFGFIIVQALVTDIDPDKKVKESMNEINAAKRLREAAQERGEADKILKVKAAEAEAESKALQGQGIANQRRAIIDGLRESVDQFAQSISGTTPESIMQLVLMTQHYDTVKEIGASSRANTIFVPYTPGGMADLASQMRDALIGANSATRNDDIDRTDSTT